MPASSSATTALPRRPTSMAGPTQAGQPSAHGQRVDRLAAGANELVDEGEEALRQPDAAGNRVVEVEGRPAGERRLDLRQHAEVARVAHEQQRAGRARHPRQADERAVERVPVVAVDQLRRRHEPGGGRVHLLLGDADRAPAHVLVGVELELLEHGHLPGDHHLAALPLAGRGLVGLLEDLEHLQRDAEVRIGVVVDVRCA